MADRWHVTVERKERAVVEVSATSDTDAKAKAAALIGAMSAAELGWQILDTMVVNQSDGWTITEAPKVVGATTKK